MNDNIGNVTTAKNFRTEDVTHTPRKQLEVGAKDSYKQVRGFEPVSKAAREKLIAKLEAEKATGVYVSMECILPLRASKQSAGYDVFSHSDMTIPAGGKATLWTNVKAYMQIGEVLLADVRSSGGIKLDLMLANTIGLIDSDYHNNQSNEGNIAICLRNMGEKEVIIKAGERVAQFVFMPFLVSDNCNNDADRLGGIGSTGR